jgi:hypothetical protein
MAPIEILDRRDAGFVNPQSSPEDQYWWVR